MPLGAGAGTEPGSRSLWLARAVALATVATSAMVLIGWAVGRPELTTFGSDISMKPNAAVCFALLGGALWRRASPPGRTRDPLALALGAAAAAIGALTLLEHLTGVDLGIDQLLFSEPPDMPATAAPARMGPPASTSFLLLGTALAWLHDRRPRARLAAQAMPIAAGFIALLPLVGYGYGTSELYGIARFTGIALPTALLLEASALASLLVAPGPGLVSAVRGGGEAQLARRTLVYSTVVPLTVGGLIAAGLKRGLYDGVFAISLLVLALILALTLLTWRDAVRIGRIARQRAAADEARRESDRRARERASELEAVLEAVPAAVLIARDRDATRIEGNRSGRELLRLDAAGSAPGSAPPGEGPGYRVIRRGTVIPPEELPLQLAAARGLQVRDWECEIAYDDGSSVHLLGYAAPLVDDHGTPRGSVGAYVDITARAKAEAELREADRRKDAFLAVLSHELRNPLAPIRNAVYLLRAAEVGAEQARRALAVIDRQVSHLTRLIEDLLDVSRITSGKVRLRRTRLDLVELARKTAEDHQAAAAAAGLDLRVEVPDRPLWVEGDEARLVQVIGNLLSNAVKFTPTGGQVLVSAAEDGGSAALLRIRDTGAGIDGGMRERLFEPFAQADSTLDRSRGGLGRGLAHVKGLVGLHEGTVEARSEGAGRGTEFLVRLPLEPAPRPPEARDGPPAPPSPLRILLVEDNRDAVETLRDALELSGHDVQAVYDGQEGLRTALRTRPDVVICDVGLPGLSGYDVARGLRGDPAMRGVVLIALTGYASPEERRRAAEAGFDHHLGKPADLGALAAVLAEASRSIAASAPSVRG
jgi:two-component system CheB/CheR fusion protein